MIAGQPTHDREGFNTAGQLGLGQGGEQDGDAGRGDRGAGLQHDPHNRYRIELGLGEIGGGLGRDGHDGRVCLRMWTHASRMK